MLESLGLASAYHSFTGEQHGAESKKTFFLTKRNDRASHIDYCFVHKSLLVASVSIPMYATWRVYSDHVPLIVDLITGA
jgi:endonuclease/exonuclease/phosphatase family metal-dependent hydrolase